MRQKYSIPRNLIQTTSLPADGYILLNNEFSQNQYVFGFEVYGTTVIQTVNNTFTQYNNITQCYMATGPGTTSVKSNKQIVTSFASFNSCSSKMVATNKTETLNRTALNNGTINVKVLLLEPWFF